MGEEQYQTLMDVNMKGVWLSSQAEARAMLAHGQGGSSSTLPQWRA
jgi:NADP-dependent 3-hydroxy acid dehydrogenase YdfG